MVPIVQLVRASDCGSECRGFESHRAPKVENSGKPSKQRGFPIFYGRKVTFHFWKNFPYLDKKSPQNRRKNIGELVKKSEFSKYLQNDAVRFRVTQKNKERHRRCVFRIEMTFGSYMIITIKKLKLWQRSQLN